MLLLAALLLAQVPQMEPCSIDGPIYCSGISRAFFEFAPLDGAGMGAACACTTPTGAKGEAMTFSRASSATCLKTVGAAPQSIANGDMVTCTSGQARVMPGPDGTAINGLLSETSRTNLAVRSQEFDNAAWTKGSVTIAAATVTADFGVAPDGTTTAERLQVAACPSVDTASYVFQIGLGSTATYSTSVLCKGTSADQTISVCTQGAGGGSSCTAVTCLAAGWRALSNTAAITTSGGPVIGCNNLSAYTGHSNTGAADVLIWGGGFELGPYATSYIATTSANVTRAGDAAGFFTNLTWPASPTLSHAGTYLAPPAAPATTNARPAGMLYVDANNNLDFYFGASAINDSWIVAGVLKDTTSSPAITVSASNRLLQYYDGATAFSCVNGSCNSTNVVFTPFSGAANICVGTYGVTCGLQTYQGDGVTKRVCYDTSATRCR